MTWPVPWWEAPHEQRLKLLDYVLVLQEKLGLRDWDVRIALEEGPEDREALAQVVPVYGRRVIKLRLAPDLLAKYEEHEVVGTLVHELLHVALHRVTEVIRTDLNAFGGLTQREYDGLWHYYNRECELAIDTLAAALEPMMPRPPWASGERETTDKIIDSAEGHIELPDRPDGKE